MATKEKKFEIKLTTDENRRKEARERKEGESSFFVPPIGMTLTIPKMDYVDCIVDGTEAKRSTPAFLIDGFDPDKGEVIYVRSQYQNGRKRRDLKGMPIPFKGTFNAWLISHGIEQCLKTEGWGAFEDKFNALCPIKVQVRFNAQWSYDKNGEATIKEYPEYDFVGEAPTLDKF